jgi:hypothetical protein
VERSKFKISEKMMKKDVSRGGEVQAQEIQKKDEKRRFRRWISKIPKKLWEKTFQKVERSKFKISEKKMRKDVSRGGDVQVQEIRKNDEKRRFRRWISKIPKKWWEKTFVGGFKKFWKNNEKMFQQVEKSKFNISEKMIRKDVSRVGEVQVQEIRKNNEKRRFRRWISKIPKKWWEKMFQQVERSKFKISEKMMRKDVSAGGGIQVQNIRKNDEKRRFRRWISKIPKKWWEKTFQDLVIKNSEKMMRKDVSAGGEIQVQNIRKNDEKRRFKRWRGPS